MARRKCRICNKNPGQEVEVEIVLSEEHQLITKSWLCGDCMKLVREHCHHADISADRRETFEEFFFDCTIVRVWY